MLGELPLYLTTLGRWELRGVWLWVVVVDVMVVMMELRVERLLTFTIEELMRPQGLRLFLQDFSNHLGRLKEVVLLKVLLLGLGQVLLFV